MGEGKSARVVQVIRSNLTMRGEGLPPGDPIRQVVQFWSVEGVLLAEVDPVHQGWMRSFDAVDSVLRGTSDPEDETPWRAIRKAYRWAKSHMFGWDKAGEKRDISEDFLLGMEAMRHIICGQAPQDVLLGFSNPEMHDIATDPRAGDSEESDQDAGKGPGE